LFEEANQAFNIQQLRKSLCDKVRNRITSKRFRGEVTTLLEVGEILSDGTAATSRLSERNECWFFKNAELYDPSTVTFTATNDMTRPRAYHTATLLPDGTV